MPMLQADCGNCINGECVDEAGEPCDNSPGLTPKRKKIADFTYVSFWAGGNTAIGPETIDFLETASGDSNTAVGVDSMHSTTTGSWNTAVGDATLSDNTTGARNTAVGRSALMHNTRGDHNIAIGESALFNNSVGRNNSALGVHALFHNSEGIDNIAFGNNALFRNIDGNNNSAFGVQALYSNTTGGKNIAVGRSALISNVGGDRNTAVGVEALYANTAASDNVAVGHTALSQNVRGGNNTAVGSDALRYATGNFNTALGAAAGRGVRTGSWNIHIGNIGMVDDDGVIRIGMGSTEKKTFIAGITGVALTGTPVVVDRHGQLGVAPSSECFKHKIKSMDKTSESIFALKPVTFYYKKEIDPEDVPQFGLVAEDVEKVNPDLVVHDKDGKPYSVRYDQVNAMLLNEFLKEHRTVKEQGATITRQRKDFEAALAQQQKQIEALTAGLQKVSAELEVIKPAPQTVLNNH